MSEHMPKQAPRTDTDASRETLCVLHYAHTCTLHADSVDKNILDSPQIINCHFLMIEKNSIVSLC